MQQRDSTQAEGAQALPETEILQKASMLIESGKYKDCLALLDEQDSSIRASTLDILRLICEICIKSQRGLRWQVLNVQAGSDTKSIKGAVRKLVVKIHPDKCDLPGAEEAFKAVLTAAEHVSANASDAPKAQSEGGNWWEEWEDPERHGKKRKADEMEEQYGEAHRIWWLHLQDMSVQDLQREVKSLQGRLLEETGLPRTDRQKRLREARALLSQRMSEATCAAHGNPVEAKQGGGFFV